MPKADTKSVPGRIRVRLGRHSSEQVNNTASKKCFESLEFKFKSRLDNIIVRFLQLYYKFYYYIYNYIVNGEAKWEKLNQIFPLHRPSGF